MRWCNGSRTFGADGKVEVAWRDHAADGNGGPLLFTVTVDARGYDGTGAAGRIGLPLRGRDAGAVDVAIGGDGLAAAGADAERLWFELRGARKVSLEMSERA